MAVTCPPTTIVDRGEWSRTRRHISRTLPALTTMPVSAPVSLHGRSSMMEQWAQFPATGSGQIEVGRPTRWNVDLAGRPQPFDVLVIAHADYGMKWDRLPVRVVFDDWPDA